MTHTWWWTYAQWGSIGICAIAILANAASIIWGQRQVRRALALMKKTSNESLALATMASRALEAMNKISTHRITCGNDKSHALLVPLWTGDRVIAVCRDCDYQIGRAERMQ